MVRRTAFATQIGKQPASLHYHTDIFLSFQPLHFHYCPPVLAHLPVVLLFSSALTCHLCFTLSPSGCLSWETSVFWRDWNRHSNIRLSHIYIHTNTMTQTLYTQLISILYCGIDVIMLRFYMHVSHTQTHTHFHIVQYLISAESEPRFFTKGHLSHSFHLIKIFLFICLFSSCLSVTHTCINILMHSHNDKDEVVVWE